MSDNACGDDDSHRCALVENERLRLDVDTQTKLKRSAQQDAAKGWAEVERLLATEKTLLADINFFGGRLADLLAVLAWYGKYAPPELVAMEGVIGEVVHEPGSHECQRLGLVPCSGCDR